LMVGRELEMLYPPKRPAATGPALLEVCGLSVDHGAVAAGFALHPGEVLGIGGMIGSGRTELFEGLMGLRISQAESVTMKGAPVTKRSVTAWAEAGLVYLTEDRKGKGLLLEEPLAPNLTLQSLELVHPKLALD